MNRSCRVSENAKACRPVLDTLEPKVAALGRVANDPARRRPRRAATSSLANCYVTEKSYVHRPLRIQIFGICQFYVVVLARTLNWLPKSPRRWYWDTQTGSGNANAASCQSRREGKVTELARRMLHLVPYFIVLMIVKYLCYYKGRREFAKASKTPLISFRFMAHALWVLHRRNTFLLENNFNEYLICLALLFDTLMAIWVLKDCR